MTEYTFKEWVEIISSILASLGFIAIVYAVFAYRLSKKQLHFSTLSRCISTYQDKFLTLNNDSPIEDVRGYLDFVNEQLFYMRNDYLPRKISLEWLDGMIDHIPVRHNGIVLNESYCLPQIMSEKMLRPYRRIDSAFTVHGKYSISDLYAPGTKDDDRHRARALLVNDIFKNIERFEYPS